MLYLLLATRTQTGSVLHLCSAVSSHRQHYLVGRQFLIVSVCSTQCLMDFDLAFATVFIHLYLVTRCVMVGGLGLGGGQEAYLYSSTETNHIRQEALCVHILFILPNNFLFWLHTEQWKCRHVPEISLLWLSFKNCNYYKGHEDNSDCYSGSLRHFPYIHHWLGTRIIWLWSYDLTPV